MSLTKRLIGLALYMPLVIYAQDADIETFGEDESVPPFLHQVSFGGNMGPSIFYGDVALYSLFPKVKDFGKSMGTMYSIFVKREVLYGLGAQLQYAQGSWRGKKESAGLYNSWFRGSFSEYTVNVTFDLGDFIFKNSYKKNRKANIYGYIGVGFLNFRSVLVWDEDDDNYRAGDIRSLQGYSRVPGTTDGILDKAQMTTEMIYPVGLNFAFKLNQKIDYHVDLSLRNSYSDKLDSWERPWTAKDKYMFIGIGLNYTFGRSEDYDLQEENKNTTGNNNAAGTGAGKDKGGFLSGVFGGKKNRNASIKDEELFNIKLKLFETQLKLFELQYLIESK